MPLQIEALKSAHVDTSKNAYLQPPWSAVSKYNASKGIGRIAAQSKRFDQFRSTGKLPEHADSEQRQRALALQDIMFQAAGFLTCKPPDETKNKRHPRWNAMTQLMADVNVEAARIGVKLVDSPTNFGAIDAANASVWLEVIDPKHRDFGVLSEDYASWMKSPKAQAEKLSFWEYIREYDYEDFVLYDVGAKSQVEKSPQGNFSEIQGQRVDTTGWSTFHEGAADNYGWGIFAVTTDGRLLVGEHKNGESASVRHTSLTGGEPILAAGEISIVQGKIVAISNLTGHYKLGSKQFVQWLASTPLVGAEVLVKTRLGVSGMNVEADKNNSGVQVETKVEDFAIVGSSVELIRKWIANGKPADAYPFDFDKDELATRAPQTSFRDLREPQIDTITAVDLPSPD